MGQLRRSWVAWKVFRPSCRDPVWLKLLHSAKKYLEHPHVAVRSTEPYPLNRFPNMAQCISTLREAPYTQNPPDVVHES